ncbi:MAG TPA: ATP-binding protein [Pyrinomonadaceae bacterium]|nr:ATP-binding protein [Pyrinomonadaceae bacterium]
MTSKKLHIFISSPGDVVPERVLAQRVIERLGYEFAAHLELEAVRWERKPMQATEHFQDNIVPPSSTDIVVVILWSKLGSDLPFDKYPGPLSGGVVTGTEWEFEEAAHARQQTGKPDLLVFRKTTKVSVPVDDDEEEEKVRAQSARAKQFVKRWFIDEKTGAYKNAYRTFNEPDQLESMLQDHLHVLIQAKVEAAVAGRRQIAWTRGSPFRGLQSFEVGDGLIFHGRTRARHELREALVAQQKRGCAFIAVVGASGSGKSSLVKAGLLSDVRIAGVVEGVGLCRYAIMRPGNAQAGLCDQLSRAFFDPKALPELAELEHTVESLAAALGEAPGQVIPMIKLALKNATKHAELHAHLSAMLVVVVDQFEEMFTTAGVGDQTPFIAALEALARSGVVWVVATLRSDFLPWIETIPRLAELVTGDGHYLVSAPREVEVAQMIKLPAEAAGLSFEIDPKTGISLDEEVRRAAGSQAGSLPLLEYVLERLWHSRTRDGMLTFASYEALGGVERTLATRAEEAFHDLPLQAQDAFPTVLRALVTVQPGDQAHFTARSAPLDNFPEGTPARALIDAFQHPDERLLVIDEGRRIRLAHEALLTHWQRASDQLDADRRYLEIRAVLEQEADRWACTQVDKDTLLLPPGIRLAEASYLLEQRAADLSATVIEYVQQSIAADTSHRARLEWQQLDAEATKLRALVEEKDARAHRNDALAARLEAQEDRPDKAEYLLSLRQNAQEFRARAEALWKEASALDDRLRNHPGAPTRAETRALPKSAVFALEMIDAKDGESFLIHYGAEGSVRFVLIDGGPRPVFKRVLGPHLADLRERIAPNGPLPLELVMISHADEDRLRGIINLLESIEEGRRNYEPDRYQIKRLWYNHFLALEPAGRKRSDRVLRRGQVASLARALGIPLNRPFDYYVMPAENGPARTNLPGGMLVTVLGPPAHRVAGWHDQWQREARKNAQRIELETQLEPQSLADQLGGAFSDGFSSPEVTLLRTKPYSASLPSAEIDHNVPSGAFVDVSATNLASIVAMFEIYGRTMLLTGDARGDDIIEGLQNGGYLGSQGPAHLDLLKLPHWGSTRNLTAEFFRYVTADHYVIAGNSRFKRPDTDILEMIAASRGVDAFNVHISIDDADEEHEERLTTAFDQIKARGSKGTLRFRKAGTASHLIDLTDSV